MSDSNILPIDIIQVDEPVDDITSPKFPLPERVIREGNEEFLLQIAHSAGALPQTRYKSAELAAEIHYRLTGDVRDPQDDAEVGAKKATEALEKNLKHGEDHPFGHISKQVQHNS